MCSVFQIISCFRGADCMTSNSDSSQVLSRLLLNPFIKFEERLKVPCFTHAPQKVSEDLAGKNRQSPALVCRNVICALQQIDFQHLAVISPNFADPKCRID